ncbi:chemosensory receptor A [Elysia marginata]|uniref:Chemosensory receptor A n=1 Tax=Elysia marginata TaxID=1093978 RepID=A0AAV4IID6_9GAST|nr:chemosensory receptor A [Elysia marginata]
MEAVDLNISLTTVSGALKASSSIQPYLQARLHLLNVLAPMWPAISLFGMVANIINIVVFLKAGVKDNVTTLLFCLAISDLTFLVLNTPNMCYWVILTYTQDHPWPFHSRFLQAMFYWPAFTAYDLSAFISVSLGVMRCACVAMPLKFKAVFTRSRTIKWVMFLVVLAVSLRIPVLSLHRIGWRTDSRTNSSVPYLENPNIKSMSRINDILNRGFVIWINYTTMITCVSVLTFKLNEASKIRRSSTAQTGVHSLSSRDLQVVKSVALVCTIFFLSQLPYLLVSMFRLVNAEFDEGTNLVELFGIVSDVARTCSVLNASVNIFVYYNYNSKYKSVFRSMMGLIKNH